MLQPIILHIILLYIFRLNTDLFSTVKGLVVITVQLAPNQQVDPLYKPLIIILYSTIGTNRTAFGQHIYYYYTVQLKHSIMHFCSTVIIMQRKSRVICRQLVNIDTFFMTRFRFRESRISRIFPS